MSGSKNNLFWPLIQATGLPENYVEGKRLTLNSSMDLYKLLTVLQRNWSGSGGNEDEDGDGDESNKLEILSLNRLELDYNLAHEIIDQLSCWMYVELVYCHGQYLHRLIESVFQPTNGIHRLSVVSEEPLDPSVVTAIRDGLVATSSSHKEVIIKECQEGLEKLSLTIDLDPETAHSILHQGINQSSLTTLDLTQCDIHPDSIDVLCQSLEENTCLKGLVLDNCRLEDDEVARVVDSLVQHANLSDLSLRMNYAEDQAMTAICKLIQSPHNNLLSLDLSQQNPGVLDLASLASALCNQNENDNGTAPITANTTTTTLQKLNLRESFVKHHHIQGFAKALTYNTSLQEINLENCGLSDSMISSLVQNIGNFKGLRKLWLRQNEFSKLDAKLLERNYMIQVLDVESELLHPTIQYNLCLNQAGREFLNKNNCIPVALWPTLFERANGSFKNKDSEEEDEDGEGDEENDGNKFGAADVLYYLLQGQSVF